MKIKIRIIIPITIFGPGGGYRVLSEFANYWIASGNEVIFLAYKGSNVPYFPTSAEVLYYDNSGNFFKNNDIFYQKPFLRILSILMALKKATDKYTGDIVLATLSITALPIYFSKIKNG